MITKINTKSSIHYSLAKRLPYSLFIWKIRNVKNLDFRVLFCTSCRVLFLLRKSFIETLRFQLYHIRLFNCAKHNITRHQPNITAKQYNSPKANITEKTFLLSQKGFFGPPGGINPPSAYFFLTAMPLRTSRLKTWHCHVFLTPLTLSGFESLRTEEQSPNLKVRTLFFAKERLNGV